MKYLLLAIILIGGGIFYFKQPKQNTHVCNLNNNNIITIGDSLANGFGVNNDDSFAIQTAKILGKTPIKRGVNGETTNGLLMRLDKELSLHSSITAIIISIGGNDFLRRYDTNTTQANIHQIIKISQKYTGCVVLLGVPNSIMNSILDGISPLYKEVASQYNILLDSQSMPQILGDTNLKLDQIHPNKEGHTIIANNIANLIKANR